MKKSFIAITMAALSSFAFAGESKKSNRFTPENYDLSCEKFGKLDILDNGKPNAAKMLDQAMNRHPLSDGEGVSLAVFDSTLLRHYHLNQSLRGILSDPATYKEVARISVLFQNFYPIAGQMAVGYSSQSKKIPGSYMQSIISYSSPIVEPYHNEPELTLMSENLEKGVNALGEMNEKAKTYAYWVIRGGAYIDFIAIDAALMGFCSMDPNENDKKILSKAFEISRVKQAD